MTNAEPTAQQQRGRPFPPGQSGNRAGRPKGSKNKLAEGFIAAIARDFEKFGADVIEQVRTHDPVAYLKIVGTLTGRLVEKPKSTTNIQNNIATSNRVMIVRQHDSLEELEKSAVERQAKLVASSYTKQEAGSSR